MKKLFFTLFFILLAASASAEDFNNPIYLKNYDGDTISFDLNEDLPNIFKTMSVRLYGIDTPEIKSKNELEKIQAIKAKNFVASELKNAKQIHLINCQKEKYFRLLCEINYDNKNLTTELLKQNLGYPYFGGKKREFLAP